MPQLPATSLRAARPWSIPWWRCVTSNRSQIPQHDSHAAEADHAEKVLGRRRNQTAGQTARNPDAAHRTTAADRSELFQVSAVCANGHRLPGSGRNPAEKICACYQRNKARDIWDLGVFATGPLDQVLIRRLVVLKLWQARDTFDPARLMRKFEDGRDFDWDDLRQLLHRAVVIDRKRITADCVRDLGFLAELTEDERSVARDQYQRERDEAERLRGAPALG
ncbi:MAG: nucleotidyl transferase AbiEii/AbiGii toxin family protein [Candidatus Sulfotelmatobacter sp.]